MNRLDINCERRTNDDGGTYYEVEFYIDGRRFLDMIQEFEAPFAGALAGQYTNVCFTYYTEAFLLGRNPECGEHGGKTELLGCTCGCRGCWPFATRIRVLGQQVIWDEFEQPHRTWSYAGFGPFVFDLEEYEVAIAQIPKVTT